MIPKENADLPTGASETGGRPVPPASVGISSSSLGMGSRRTTVSLSDLRTPLVENIMSMLPIGHDKAFKYALYNVVAMILAAVCVIACWAAYCILEPFIVPLLWALLSGSVIHPFKDRLVSFTKEWIVMVKGSSTPLAFQVASIPFRVVDSLSESIGSRVTTWWKYILTGAGGFFLTYLIYHNPPVTLGLIVYWICVSLIKAVFWFVSWINGQFVAAITAVYVGAIVHFVFDIGASQKVTTGVQAQNSSESVDGKNAKRRDSTGRAEHPKEWTNRNKLMVRTLSVTVWIMWFIYFCRFLPYPILLMTLASLGMGTVVFLRKYSFRKPMQDFAPYAAVVTLLGGGLPSTSRTVSRKGSIQDLKTRRNTHFLKTHVASAALPVKPSTSSVEGKPRSSTSILDTPIRKKLSLELDAPLEVNEALEQIYPFSEEDSLATLINYCGEADIASSEEEFPEDEVDGLLDSNKYLYGVFCACLVVQVWNRLWLIHLLPIPVIYYGLKRMCLSFGFHEYLYAKFVLPFRRYYICPGTTSRDFFPQPIRVFFRITRESDKKVISIFESYLDMVATIVILVAALVVSVIFLIFVATQFYAEGDHLVRVGANVINSTVSQYPEISRLLPEGWESLSQSLIGNAYHYGRDYIKTLIRDSVAEKNPEKAEEMENQVIELWDRIYISWNQTWGSLDEMQNPNAMRLDWDDFVKTGQNVTNWFDTTMMVNYAKSNYGQLRGILESIWSVLIGNVSLAISAITSIFSVLFGGGTALLNLIINFVVFFTALFYLLSMSTSVYKPVELFNSWFPGDGRHSSNFVSAIEESVSGVFSATLKMSAFYGMWTWLIHTLFQVNIVFVPSFFAAIFAAVPLLMPYWAAFPACLELGLIQGRWTMAICMLLAQMAPMSLVDAQIYSEIKGGGHPYLTALAVAGGIFYFGFQGAVMGPVVLCFLFVAVKVGSAYMKEGAI